MKIFGIELFGQKKVAVTKVDTLLRAINFEGGLSALVQQAQQNGRSLEKEIAAMLKQADVDEAAALEIYNAAMALVDEVRIDARHKQEDHDEIMEAVTAFRK